MDESSESKRDQAVLMASKTLLTFFPDKDDRLPRLATLVGLIIDAAKEEIRAELVEQEEERRWHQIRSISDGPDDGPLGVNFREEYWALRAKREAAGKKID